MSGDGIEGRFRIRNKAILWRRSLAPDWLPVDDRRRILEPTACALITLTHTHTLTHTLTHTPSSSVTLSEEESWHAKQRSTVSAALGDPGRRKIFCFFFFFFHFSLSWNEKKTHTHNQIKRKIKMQQRSGVGGNNDVEMMRPSTKSKKKK